ncbi:MAG: four helix bundle protein [Thermoleophilaceae bacterium]
MASRYRRLRVYQLSVALAWDVRSHVRGWSSFDQSTLGVQLVRAIESVGANIAEAEGRWYTADKRRLLFIARGSLYEAEHWLLRAEQSGLRRPDASDRIDEIARMLNGMIKKPPPR